MKSEILSPGLCPLFTPTFLGLFLPISLFLVPPACPSTATRTWWTRTTWPYASAPHSCPHQTARIRCPARPTSMRSSRPSSSIMRPSFLMLKSWMGPSMRSVWLEETIGEEWLTNVLSQRISYQVIKSFWINSSHLNAKISLEMTCDCLSQLENTVGPHYILLHGPSSN